MNAIEVLRKMEERLAVPEHWTQLADARNRWQSEVSPFDVTAVCWCIHGALRVAAPLCILQDTVGVELSETLKLRGLAYYTHIGYNDTHGRTHGEILSLLRETRERLEAA
jgi:hypothetical protein